MEMLISNGFEQLSSIEQENINGGDTKPKKGDLNKAAASAAAAAVLTAGTPVSPVCATISAACWLLDAVLPDSAYQKETSGGSSYNSGKTRSF